MKVIAVENGKKWSDSEYILKIVLSSFALGLDTKCVRKGTVKNNLKFSDM